MNSKSETPIRRGRPSFPKGTAKTILAGFKVSETEAEIIAKASKRADKEKSEWMRSVILEAAQAA